MLQEDARAVIESGRLAHVVTTNADGTPHVTIAWVGLEDDTIVIATLMDQRKLQNMRRNPNVAISIQTEKINEHGLNEYLVVYGTASVDEGGAPEMLQQLAHTYLGPKVKFPPFPNPPPGYVTRVTVDRFGGIGPWAKR